MTPPSNFGRPVTRPTWVTAGLLALLCVTGLGWGLESSTVAENMREYGPGIANHPVGVIPSAAVTVPPSWPLDDDGAITCFTCHTAIQLGTEYSGPGLRDFDSEAAQATRREGPVFNRFCAKCHSRGERRSSGSMHWLGFGVAHVLSHRKNHRDDGRTLDSHTRQCLSCHDGASATESTSTTPWSRPRGYLGDHRVNHPVGVRYGSLSRPKDLAPLRPVSLLPRGVALPDGKVGCISCHNLYAGEKYLLTVPIQGSELCLTCHDMR